MSGVRCLSIQYNPDKLNRAQQQIGFHDAPYQKSSRSRSPRPTVAARRAVRGFAAWSTDLHMPVHQSQAIAAQEQLIECSTRPRSF